MSETLFLESSEALSALAEMNISDSRVSFFQTAPWLALWNSRPRFQCEVMVAYDGDVPVGYFPFCTRRKLGFVELYSMPMGTYGGPVVLDSERASLESLTKQFLESTITLKSSRVNIVDFSGELGQAMNGFRVSECSTHVVDLGLEIDGIRSKLSENHRRNLDKSQSLEFDVRTVETAGDIESYARISAETDLRHGVKHHIDRSFFESIPDNIPDLNLQWQVVYVDAEPCVGHIYFLWGDSVFYWHGCSNEKGLVSGANFRLFWDNIRNFHERGFVSLNLGASPAVAGELERFKRGWGGIKRTYHEYERESTLHANLRKTRERFKR